jgi:protein TonB
MKNKKSVILILLLFSFSIFSQEKKLDEDVSFSIIEKVPVYPGCKGDNKDLKTCFSKSIQTLFAENFNSDLPNQINLKGGKYKVFIGFKISSTGEVLNIVVKAPHIKLKEESLRVMNLAPKMIPGEAKGKTVGVKYMIPFTIIVEEVKKETRRERRKRERRERKNKN